MNFFKVVFYSILISLNLCGVKSNSLIANQSECEVNIVETIPNGLTFNSSVISISTFDGLISLISSANHSIEIASFYWTLLGTDVMPKPDESSLKGKQLMKAIIDSSKSRGVKIRIAVNQDQNSDNSTDLNILEDYADIHRLNFTRLIGAGILHTKFIVIDGRDFYIGSANMDWRSLTQVKEMGLILSNCEALAQDLSKIFEIYWYLGEPNATIPSFWPKELSTEYNRSHPMSVSLNDSDYNVFLSSSPKSFCSFGRTNDIDAILAAIRSAKKFIYIAVMDYFPIFLYSKNNMFWPIIDDALKEAAINRKVSVRLMASHWNHTRKSMPIFLESLAAFNDTKLFGADIEVKLFVVPAFTPSQASIPFARVNHNKYMITDEDAYIGTSNWSADYFVNTAGVGLTVTPKQNGTNLRTDLKSIFERDWSSSYAKHL